MGITSTITPQITNDVKILAQGTYNWTGDGTYKDIVTIDIPACTDGDYVVIEAFSIRTLGGGNHGVAFDNVAGNSGHNAAVSTGDSTYSCFKLFKPNYLYLSHIGTGLGLTTDFLNDETQYGITTAEQIFLKSPNTAAGTNSIIKYIAYLVQANQE